MPDIDIYFVLAQLCVYLSSLNTYRLLLYVLAQLFIGVNYEQTSLRMPTELTALLASHFLLITSDYAYATLINYQGCTT